MKILETGYFRSAVMIAVVALVAGCGGSSGDSSSTTDTPDSPTNSMANYTNTYMGFKIYRPDGWTMDASNGTVSGKETSGDGSTGTLIYPVSLDGTVSAEDFMEGYFGLCADVFQSQRSETITLGTTTSPDSSSSSANFTGTMFGSTIKGYVSASSFTSSNGKSALVFKAFWAPESSYDSKESQLEDIIGSYSSVSTEALVYYPNYQSSGWNVSAPVDWEIGTIGQGVTSSFVDISDPSDDNTSFALLQWTYDSVPSTPKEYLDRLLAYFIYTEPNITDVQSDDPSYSEEYFDVPYVPGYPWEVVVIDAAYKWKGESVKGRWSAAVLNGYGAATAFAGAIQAPTAIWDDISPLLEYIQNNKFIISTQSIQDAIDSHPLPKNQPMDDWSTISDSAAYRNAVNDEANFNWDSYIRDGDVKVVGPDGKDYEVPNGNYNAADGKADLGDGQGFVSVTPYRP